MTFFATLAFSQPEKPTFRRGLTFDVTDAKSAIVVIAAYVRAHSHFADYPQIELETLATRKTRGIEYVRI